MCLPHAAPKRCSSNHFPFSVFLKQNVIAQAADHWPDPREPLATHCLILEMGTAGSKVSRDPETQTFSAWSEALEKSTQWMGFLSSFLFFFPNHVDCSTARLRRVCLCSHAAHTDGPGHHQNACSFPPRI